MNKKFSNQEKNKTTFSPESTDYFFSIMQLYGNVFFTPEKIFKAIFPCFRIILYLYVFMAPVSGFRFFWRNLEDGQINHSAGFTREVSAKALLSRDKEVQPAVSSRCQP